MTSLRLRLFGGAIRPLARFVLGRATDPKVERRRFARLAKLAFIAPRRGVSLSEEPAFRRDGLPALWVTPEAAPGDRAILHFHGGGYIVGSPRTHWKTLGHLGRLAGLRVFLPHYRLAPEHPLPAAQEDGRAAWDFLLAQGYAADRIALGGDSAGGGIALALMADLLAEGLRPAALYLWSPFADQTFSGASVRECARSDHYFPADRLHDLPEMILGGGDPADPRVSPLFADFPSPPPAFIQASSCEILRDDAVRIARKLRDGGGEVTLELQDDAPHVWHLLYGWVPEAGDALRRTADFLRQHLGG